MSDTTQDRATERARRFAEAEENSAAYWERIADHHYEGRKEAEARADRWKANALAWERYDHAFMVGTEEEVNRAKGVLDATYGQLREFGDLDIPEAQS